MKSDTSSPTSLKFYRLHLEWKFKIFLLLGFYISFSDAVPVAFDPHDVDGERVHYHRRRRREVRHRIGPLHACQGTKYKKTKIIFGSSI